MSDPRLAPELFRRVDESPDAEFYAAPRMVTHIDAATIDALTQVYRERLSAGQDVLDLMSSWISHLPPELELGRVAGLGMNREELEANPRLGESVVHDLNAEPELPWPVASFDAVLIAVSVQYLI
ncbi:MAG: methyltransferase type 11, partial [bacterium]|nr:methyltransferase type 11 [bacterium]